jgi:hypothetical protein
VDFRGAWEQRFHDRNYALAQAWQTGHQQRPLATRELLIKNQERDSPRSGRRAGAR